MWNFQGSWILALEFPTDVTQIGNTILWNFHGWSFVLFGISKGKVKKMKNSRFFFLNKYVPDRPPPPVRFFSGIAQSNLHFNMPFKVSPKAKDIINGGFIFRFHDGIHLKILPTLLEMFFR